MRKKAVRNPQHRGVRAKPPQAAPKRCLVCRNVFQPEASVFFLCAGCRNSDYVCSSIVSKYA
jgi:hypothetical protein